LEEGGGDARTHVDAGIEQLGGNPCGAAGDMVIAETKPVEAAVDGRRFGSRKKRHRTRVTVRASSRFGYTIAGRSAAIGGMVGIAALALDQPVDQLVDIMFEGTSVMRGSTGVERTESNPANPYGEM
jgi:hypothetical protein